MREVLGERWWQALLLASGRWVLDYLTLLAALTAVDAIPRPSTVLLAFCAAQFLGTLPLTPGGLGFVEAGLTGTLALAGVPAGAAVVATLAYRLVSFWLPIPAGASAAICTAGYYGEADGSGAQRPRRPLSSENVAATPPPITKPATAAPISAPLAVLGQLTAPVGQLRHLGAQVVDREAQLLARRLDRGSDHLGALGRPSAPAFSPPTWSRSMVCASSSARVRLASSIAMSGMGGAPFLKKRQASRPAIDRRAGTGRR